VRDCAFPDLIPSRNPATAKPEGCKGAASAGGGRAAASLAARPAQAVAAFRWFSSIIEMRPKEVSAAKVRHPQVQALTFQLLTLSPGIRSAAEDMENRCDVRCRSGRTENPGLEIKIIATDVASGFSSIASCRDLKLDRQSCFDIKAHRMRCKVLAQIKRSADEGWQHEEGERPIQLHCVQLARR
jgi:hypothetical protein